jgi:hypothetical protein
MIRLVGVLHTMRNGLGQFFGWDEDPIGYS